MPLRAIIFDFDGLILDTETAEMRAWQKVFRKRGCEFPESWLHHAIGRGIEQAVESPLDILDRLTGAACDRYSVHSEYELLKTSYVESYPVLPGVRELIQIAKGARLLLGVASSSKHVWVDYHLKRLGLFDSFNVIVCADDVVSTKPFPDLYIEACKRLDVSPSDAVALEDSENGVRAARDAGICCIAVPNPCTMLMDFSRANRKLESLATLTVESLEQILIDSLKPPEATPGMDRTTAIRSKCDEIVAEMKSLGAWDLPKPSNEDFENMGAFGMNTMTLEQWLQYVLVERIQSLLNSRGPWPTSSSVGAHAVREFDGRHEYSHLVSLLCEFDDLF